jgi:hypothetical protein
MEGGLGYMWLGTDLFYIQIKLFDISNFFDHQGLGNSRSSLYFLFEIYCNTQTYSIVIIYDKDWPQLASV